VTKYIEVCKKISQNLNESGFPLLKEVNLHTVFEPLYDMNFKLNETNALVCFIIFAYDPDSSWLDLRKDRIENKHRIIEGLGMNPIHSPFDKVLNGENEKISDICLNFLLNLTDWRWQTVFSLLEYHAKMIRYCYQNTESEMSFEKLDGEGQKQTLFEDLDEDKVSKINKNKGELLELAIKRRKQADELLSEIRKDFVNTDASTNADFGFMFSETAKEKVDILSWRHFIKARNERKPTSAAG
jgi:hypothetical protein